MFKRMLFVALFGLSSFTTLASNTLNFQTRIMGEGTVYEAIDGDTVWLNVSDQSVFNRFMQAAKDNDTGYAKKKSEALRPKYRSVKMRIANINTEESVHRDISRNTKEGKKASAYLKGLANSRPAKFACWDHGKYGRPICSVEILDQDGDFVDIGYRMISQGYSIYVTKYGTHPYAHKEYRSAEN